MRLFAIDSCLPRSRLWRQCGREALSMRPATTIESAVARLIRTEPT